MNDNRVKQKTRFFNSTLCKPVLGLVCSYFLLSPVLGQEKSSPDQSAASPDTTVVLFEDIFARYVNGFAPSLGFTHSRYERDESGTTLSRMEYNHTTFGITEGDRRSHRVHLELTNLAGSQSEQSYTLQAGFRPTGSAQIAGEVHLLRYPGAVYDKTLYTMMSLTYLSGGGVNYDPDNFAQYFHYSDLLVRRGAVVASLSPSFQTNKLGNDPQPNSLEGIASSGNASTGISDRMTLSLAGAFSRSAGTYQSFFDRGSQGTGIMNANYKFRS